MNPVSPSKETPKKVILTGDRPTGQLHLGHYAGSLRSRVTLQNEYEMFVLIADMQALTDYARTPEIVRNNILEVACDYLAVGIDPVESHIVVQSLVPELAELYMLLSNLIGIGRVERNPTVKAEIQQKGMGDHIPAGFVMYPVSQAADITGFGADLVPVGADQAPMIELTNDIVQAFTSTYQSDALKPVEALIPKVGARLPSVDGKSKMSKSLGNALYLDADDKTIAQAVNAMYPGMDGRQINEPGVIEGNVIMTYLDTFDPDRTGLESLKAAYQKGGIGDGELKKRLLPVLKELIGPIRERRQAAKQKPQMVIDAIMAGTQIGRARAQQVLGRVKEVMKIDYHSYFRSLQK